MLQLDPETSLGLLLRLAGAAAFLLLAAAITGALLVAAIGFVRGSAEATRRAGMAALALAGVYGALLLAGPLLLGRRTLAPGQELAFCGFDCHLHLTATHVARDGGLDVTVRARSDARAAPEDPRYVTLSVVDASGTRYPADSMTLDTPLGPGDVYERTLHFAVPASATGLRLVGTWQGWPAYAIPGPDNIFVQRRSGIVLTADTGAT
ncbi:MAG: hypothetical protein H6Q77_559 [Gemmatimonadetes bacterium]|jgi:hypothetical protein|nr:hypothetical protein [Gemmatimonadota bacterium]